LYELRSAFNRGSIHGYIYLEATMNHNLISLLKRIPGIRYGTAGLRYDSIPPEDWESLLVMQDVEATPVKGEWVAISRGKYKGDLAFVSSLEEWQGVEVLLIPRFGYGDKLPSSKRKRSATRPPLQLFDPRLVPRNARIQPVKLQDRAYRYGSLCLENGLLRQPFDFHSVSRAVPHMPTEVIHAYRQSEHAEILSAKFPCPLEFKFEENELVRVLPSNRSGKITASRPCESEVELLNGEGCINVSWMDMRKYVELGNYVVVLSGVHRGFEGFVTGAKGDSVVVTDFNERSTSSTIDPSRVMKVRSTSTK
jgi:transcription antitermination factor NusG